jgi:hypothetical protein
MENDGARSTFGSRDWFCRFLVRHILQKVGCQEQGYTYLMQLDVLEAFCKENDE